MDGSALVRELYQLGACKYTPVLMLATETSGEKCRKSELEQLAGLLSHLILTSFLVP